MQSPSLIAQEQSRLEDIDVRLAEARIKSWAAVEAIAQAMEPGMRESEAIKLAQKTLVAMGSHKFWHKCHIRFGADTVLSFNDEYRDTELGADDIFYVDIGPIWDGIEGDAGSTFVVGSDSGMLRCKADVRVIFQQVKDHWQNSGATGKKLYEYAAQKAEERGWILAPSYVRGHRLSEFPHSFHTSLHVDELDFCPARNRWVLEIHICDREMRYGAFHEDLL